MPRAGSVGTTAAQQHHWKTALVNFYSILLKKCLWCQRCSQGEHYGFKQVSQRQGQAQRSCQGLQEGQSRHPHLQKHLAGFKYLTTLLRNRLSSRHSPHQKIPGHLASQLIGLNENSVVTWHYSPPLSYTLICGKWHTLELPGPMKALVIFSNYVPFHVYCAFSLSPHTEGTQCSTTEELGTQPLVECLPCMLRHSVWNPALTWPPQQ